jgi:hypothetical protein
MHQGSQTLTSDRIVNRGTDGSVFGVHTLCQLDELGQRLRLASR